MTDSTLAAATPHTRANTATQRTAAPSAALATRTMRAMARDHYGEPDVLSLRELPTPSPGPGEVLVRVRAAAVTIGDHHVITGRPYLVRVSPFGGLPRPRHAVPGGCLSGVVEALGAGVTTLAIADEVLGEALHGAFGELAVVPVDRLTRKPASLSFEEAAAVPWATAALQGLRDAGALRAGQRALVIGASGGVGTWAVQIAKALDAHVTAVCSTRHVARMRALGADEVIDYQHQDFARGAQPYDVVFDLVGNRALSECRAVLAPRGTYVAGSGAGGDWLGPLPALAWLATQNLFTRQRLVGLFADPNAKDLTELVRLIETRGLRPTLERVVPLAELPAALRLVGEGHSAGQTVVRVS